MRSISFIGSGNVATHLGLALKNKNYQIKQVFSRTLENAKILAQSLDAEATNDLLSLRTVDLIIISIKDNEISEIIKKINNSPIVHTSGSVDITVFENNFKQCGVFYPLQTFNKDINLDFSNIPICIETNNKEFEIKLRDLANCISNKVIYMNSEQRKQLHIAAVFSANFSNHMFLIAENILNKAGIRFSILLPLIQQTIKKLEKNKAKDIQTGPARRKDTSIIKDHLSNIKDKDIKEIYHKISASIIKEHE